MPPSTVDLDRLAIQLQAKIKSEDLSLRAAAEQIGSSPATLLRLLKGAQAPNTPDSATLFRAASWLKCSLAEFARGTERTPSSMADVEIHLRALPGLAAKDIEALVAMVKAAHDAALDERKKIRAERKGTAST